MNPLSWLTKKARERDISFRVSRSHDHYITSFCFSFIVKILSQSLVHAKE